MGLLDKTNPAATRESVVCWAIFGAIAGPILVFLRLMSLSRRYLLPILIAAAIGGAVIGAVIEWQLDDGEDAEKVTEAIPPSGVWDRELDHEYTSGRRDA